MPSSARAEAAEATADTAAARKSAAKPATKPRPRKNPNAATISSRPTAPAPITQALSESAAEASAAHSAHSASVAEVFSEHSIPPVHTAVASATAAPRMGMPAQPGFPGASQPKPMPVNVMELLIENKIEEAMSKFRCCNCATCRQDITAYALNKLTPRYIVQDAALVTQALQDPELNSQVTTALVQAILKIKANPKH